jgi:parvulin-like peptidyl-prolyl isomerase
MLNLSQLSAKRGVRKNSAKATLAATITGALALQLFACSFGPVAATVNGNSIPEAIITSHIEGLRSSEAAYENIEVWLGVLEETGLTPESLREQIINDTYVPREIVKQAAKEQNIKVEASAIDDAIKNEKQQFNNDEDAWLLFLRAQNHPSIDEYKSYLEYTELYNLLAEAIAPQTTPTKAELDSYARVSATSLGKRGSIIFISNLTRTDAQAQAAALLAKINEGEDFATTAIMYSDDTVSGPRGGDLGWETDGGFNEQLKATLDALGVDEVSNVVEADEGYYIVKCTADYNVPSNGQVNIADIPESALEQLSAELAQAKQEGALKEYLGKRTSEAKIVINPIPSGLSYTEAKQGGA